MAHRPHIYALALSLAAIATPAAVWAFGDQGHQIICAIAMKELTPSARAKVNKIMAPETHYNTFWEACVWPDHPRKRGPEHFINEPRSTDAITANTCPQADTCLFTAIATDEAAVGDTNADKEARLESLKYLGHWMGDIHQPLHVSFEDDRGGNKIKSKGVCSSNLHSDWDTCLVVTQLGGGNPNTIAKNIRKSISDADRAKWTQGGPVDWANESYQISTGTGAQYCVDDHGVCQYDATHEEFSEGDTEKKITVNQAYVDANGPVLEEQVKKAGVRLGKMLETLLNPT